MGPLLHSEDKIGSKERDCCNLNKPGRALEHGSKSIVMKGRGISCASSSSSVVNYGCVSLSLVL